PEDRKNDDLKRQLFAEQIKWYEDHHDAFVEKKKVEGKYRGTVKSVLKPLHALGKQIYRNTGAHLLGHLVITDHEADGRSRSVSWGCTDVVKQVIEDNAVDLRTQLTDIECLIRNKEMKLRGIDAELAKLAHACTKGYRSSRDRDRSVISACFIYDLERCIGIKTVKLTPSQFVANAYKFHVRVINWPVDLPFFAVGLEDLHAMNARDLKKVAGPRIAHVLREIKGEDVEDAEKCFEVVSWDDDEIELSLEDKATVPIVLDTDGNTVVTVSYSSLYCDEVKANSDSLDDFYEDDEDPNRKGDARVLPSKTVQNATESMHKRPPQANHNVPPKMSQIEARLLRRAEVKDRAESPSHGSSNPHIHRPIPFLVHK
ncbi:hypothetical protein FB446DRAFT_795932, partial [Lentinula raphanica]